jgi:hypothetical protein
LVHRPDLNGCKGVVAKQAGGGIFLNLFIEGKTMRVRIDDDRVTVTPIAQDWLATTRGSHFDQIGMMSCFRAPGRPDPPAFTNFVRRREPPSTQTVEDFWGSEVYDYMMKALHAKLAAPHGKKKLLWHFADGAAVCCGLVFGDGGQQSGQMSEQGHIVPQGEHFWPVIFVTVGDWCLVWCQAQAVNGSQPWWTHPSRVVKLRAATLRISRGESRLGGATQEDSDWVDTPGPTFEEISDDDEWTLVG